MIKRYFVHIVFALFWWAIFMSIAWAEQAKPEILTKTLHAESIYMQCVNATTLATAKAYQKAGLKASKKALGAYAWVVLKGTQTKADGMASLPMEAAAAACDERVEALKK